jgi:ElaB/YqjD/DUF883 family membrane-anchored ribosome-binding protein
MSNSADTRAVTSAAKKSYESAKDTVEEAKEYVSDKAGDIKSQFEETSDKVASYAKSNPLKALGIAGLVGYLLSKIV